MNPELKAGDRVRVLVGDRETGIRPGDKGFVWRADRTDSGALYYVLAMDRPDLIGKPAVFAEDEIEADDQT